MARPSTCTAAAALAAATCAALVLCLATAFPAADEDAGQARLAEVRQGIEGRASALDSATGTAEVEQRFSPRRCAEVDERAKEQAAWAGSQGEVPPATPVHKSLWFFSFDGEKRRWRCEARPLTDSGHLDWTFSSRLGLRRDVPLESIYRVAICDGAQVYDYKRAGGRGRGCVTSELDDPDVAEMMLPITRMERALLGASATFMELLDDPEYTAAFEGEEQIDDHRCLKITARRGRPFLSGWVITVWVAPGLDFALVREERARCPGGWSPDGAAPYVERKHVIQAADFARVSDVLCCPQVVQEDVFDYVPADQEPWDYTRIIRIRSLELNTPLQGIEIPDDFPPPTRMLAPVEP